MHHINSVSLEWMHLSPCVLSRKATCCTWLSVKFYILPFLTAFLSIPVPNDFFKKPDRSVWRLLPVIVILASHVLLSPIVGACPAHGCCCHSRPIALYASGMSLPLKTHSAHSLQVIHNMQSRRSSTVAS